MAAMGKSAEFTLAACSSCALRLQTVTSLLHTNTNGSHSHRFYLFGI